MTGGPPSTDRSFATNLPGPTRRPWAERIVSMRVPPVWRDARSAAALSRASGHLNASVSIRLLSAKFRGQGCVHRSAPVPRLHLEQAVGAHPAVAPAGMRQHGVEANTF